MSVKVLLKEYPRRSLALVTSDHALVFHHNPNASHDSNSSTFGSVLEKNATAPRIMVEFSSLSAVDLHDYRPISHPCKGTLGLMALGGDVFICLVNGSSHVATVRPGERVERIQSVEFHCLNRSDYDRMLEMEVNSYSTAYLDEDGFDYSGRQPTMEHPCLAIKKLLSGGTFYYSTDFDLTNRLQNRSIEPAEFDIDNFDPSFLWNSFMISPLIRFRSQLSNSERKALDASHLLTSAIRGFVETLTIPHSSSFSSSKKVGVPATLTLISRLSCKRAGTRFNARGIDDEGNVANFVETETIIWDPAGGAAGAGLGFSYCQVRGSVPVFWEQQTGLLPSQQKIQLSRSPEATQPAFDRHFESLTLKYGTIHVVNLLSATKPGEIDLSKRFRYHIRNSPLNNDPGYSAEKFSTGQIVGGATGRGEGTLIRATEYDFHAETQGRYENAHAIKHLLEQSAEGFAYFLMEELDSVSASRRLTSETAIVVLQQEGIFRSNCLDCLDRTNLVQGILSQLAIESFLYHRQDSVGPDFWMRHSALWADNGDALSKIYAGTGALKSSFTRHGKTSLGGLIADARKSATRMYINKFVDGGRQETIDILLGRQLGQEPVSLYDPINDYAQAELSRRSPEYSSSHKIQIFVGTFNVNGRTTGINDDLSSWLCPLNFDNMPELFVIGFQEIVELSPQQIMSTDPACRQFWEKAVLHCLNENAAKQGSDEYILLRSGQLVGAALMIFVRSSAIGNIKNVEGSLKKTGMSGIAGNKGAVAIRMEYASTRLCFVTAHLAAGFSNYEERNRDYRVISHGLRFQRGRTIDDHDTVIWLGDFNYRIGLPDDHVRKLIEVGDLQTLYDNDQLNLQMLAGLTFPYYSEALLTFAPTYKFDIGKDIYDTSEKARIPAWCDRILFKGPNLKQTSYNYAPLRFSDHRPVYATFKCQVTYIDEALKERLSREIYFKRRSEVGGSNGNLIDLNGEQEEEEEEEEEDLLLGDEPTLVPGLPPPSSDKRKWWLDNGNLARSSVKPPGPDYVYNHKKPSNPFNASTEADWIKAENVLGDLNSANKQQQNGNVIRNVSPTRSLTINSNNTGQGSARRKLPPPFDPDVNLVPALPLRANTFNTTTSAPSSFTTSMPVKRRVLAPPPDTYPQSSTSSSMSTQTSNISTPLQSMNKLPLAPIQARPVPPVSTTTKPLPPTTYDLAAPSSPTDIIPSSSMAKKPPVPKKPSVLTKQPPTPSPPPPSHAAGSFSPALKSHNTGPAASTSSKPNVQTRPGVLTKPPPAAPSSSAATAITHSSLISLHSTTTTSVPSNTITPTTKPKPKPKLTKPPPVSLVLTNSNTNTPSAFPPIAPVPVPPPPRKAVPVSVSAPQSPVTASHPHHAAPPHSHSHTIPLQQSPQGPLSEDVHEKPPLPARAGTDLVNSEVESARRASTGNVREGVEVKSQITDVRRGVAQWEEVGAGTGR
ncbi:SacI homology domain-containing protein [Kalaharituber pfeilii]|nr:SacI homology domain-containing protein [Kalaharituber pfeilii]